MPFFYFMPLPARWLSLLLVLMPGLAAAQAWTALTTGSPLQAQGTSQTRGTTTDAAGNVFVTGSFTGQVVFGSTVLSSRGNSDLFVAKYVPTTDTWAWAQSAGGTGADGGNAIAVNTVAGTTSVYVTGGIVNNAANANDVRFDGTTAQAGVSTTIIGTDLVVAKYVDNGASATLAWTQVGGGNASDTGQSIAVLTQGGSTRVYVSGTITNNSNNTFQVVFGGTGLTAGTVAQAGASYTTSADLLLVKYLDNGPGATVAWTQAGGGIGADSGAGVAVSGSSVYVTGALENSTSNSASVLFGATGTTPGTVVVNGASPTRSADLLLAKYTDNGATATFGWSQVGGGSSFDQGYAVAVSAASGPTAVYVAGTLANNTFNGTRALFGGGGTTPGTVPQAGATPSTSADLLLAKYLDNGAAGALAWTQVGGGTGSDIAQAVAVSGSAVYVVGTLVNNVANASAAVFRGTGLRVGTASQAGASATSSADMLVARYVDNGADAVLSWTQVGGGPAADQGLGLALSSANVYVAGSATPPATYGSFTVAAPTGPPPATPGVNVLGTLANAGPLPLLPAVTAVVPALNATAAARTAPLTISFSQPLAASAPTGLKVFSAQRGGLRTGTGAVAVSGNALVFTPTSFPFVPGETVQYTATPAVTSTTNGALVTARVGQFTAAVGGSGRGSFVLPANPAPAVGNYPQSVAVGDLDGDGDLDLATADAFATGTVSVRFNNGAASFTAPASGGTVAMGNAPRRLALGDLDGDGDLDIAVSVSADNVVKVLLNNGQGGFAVQSGALATEPNPMNLALGDVDSDGDLDLLVASSQTAGVVMEFLNDGAARFEPAPAPTLAVGSLPGALALADLDRDGDLDLLTVNSGSSTISVRLNDGQGAFAASAGGGDFTATQCTDLAVGDLDGDGDADLVASSQANNVVRVLLNDGNAGFVPAPATPAVTTGNFPTNVALGDADADGDLDLFSVNQNPVSVSLRLNNGSGAFAAPAANAETAVGNNPFGIALGDLDADGDLDLLVPSQSTFAVSIRLNGGTGLAARAGANAAALRLYPNPARGTVQVAGGVPFASITVVDVLGRAVATTRTDGTGTATLALPAGLVAGVYVVRVGAQALRLTVE